MNKIKKIIRNVPFIGPLMVKTLKALGYKKDKVYNFKREDPKGESENFKLDQTKNLLNYSKTSGSYYAAINFPAGYHTLNILGNKLKGRRNPHERFNQVDYDFKGKKVLDIGSNQGGMLFEIKDSIKWGVGIDYDHKMVNVANKICQVESLDKISFYNFNLENEPLELIEDFLPEKNVDVVFLLAVCRWISNWKEVLNYCAKISDILLIETNGTLQEQDDQIRHVVSLYGEVNSVSTNSNDDPERNDRRLYLCKK